MSAADAGLGLETISGIFVSNGTVVDSYFTPGSTLPATLSAVKADQAPSTVGARAALRRATMPVLHARHRGR